MYKTTETSTSYLTKHYVKVRIYVTTSMDSSNHLTMGSVTNIAIKRKANLQTILLRINVYNENVKVRLTLKHKAPITMSGPTFWPTKMQTQIKHLMNRNILARSSSLGPANCAGARVAVRGQWHPRGPPSSQPLLIMQMRPQLGQEPSLD